MTMKLESLYNASRPYKRRIIVGRGPGSRRGKTSRRGQKGMGARSGYQTRQGWEGGGVPLFKRLPTRGFSNARFACKLDVINLSQIDKMYKNGETVSLETLKEKGFLKGRSHGIKVLGEGTLTKKWLFKLKPLAKCKGKIGKSWDFDLMFESIRRVIGIPELRGRILFTILMMIVCRIGVFIPVPGINGELALAYFKQATGGGQNLFQLVDIFSGGAFAQMTVIALGVVPYISASIILQLMLALLPDLQREVRENPDAGRRKINKYTRLLTVFLAIVQSSLFARYAVQMNFANPGIILPEMFKVQAFGAPWLFYLITVVDDDNGHSVSHVDW